MRALTAIPIIIPLGAEAYASDTITYTATT